MLGSPMCLAQTAIFIEDFNSYSDGATSGTNWTVNQFDNCETADTDYAFNVVSGSFLINDVEGTTCGCPVPAGGDNSNIMTMTGIDISGFCNVFADFDFSASGDLECNDGGSEAVIFCPPFEGNGRDALSVEAIIDGTAHILLYVCGSGIVNDNRNNPLPSGSTMNIRITGGTSSNDESYDIDNIGVYGNPMAGSTTISANRSTTVCFGESITLTAEGPGPYLWNTTSTEQSITISPDVSTNYSVVVGTGCSESMANQVVTVLPEPDADAGPNQTICRDQSVRLEASGGSSYTWDDGQTGPAIRVAPTTTTTYTVTVSTGSNCIDIDQVTVTVNNPPNVVAINDQEVCQGQSVTLTASGANTYSWSNDRSGSSITFVPTSSGNYTVTGISNGCDDTDEVFVTVKPNPMVSAGDDITVCEGASATLVATGADDYTWSNGDSGSSIMVTTSSIQRLRVTGERNGCFASDEVLLFVQSKITADAGRDQEICNGDDAILAASGGMNYEWSEGTKDANTTVRPTSTQTYTVTVTDGACSATDEVAVIVRDPFTFLTTPDTTICDGAIIKLRADGPANTSYRWSTGINTNEIEVQPTSATSYTVVATDGICDVVQQINVDIDNINLSLSPDAPQICTGDDVLINTISNGMISWPDGIEQLQRSFRPTKDTSYTAEATSQRGCKITDKVSIIVHPLPALAIDGQPYFCIGSTTEIIATSGLSYTWDDGNSDQVRIIRAPGTYTVDGTDVNGCESEASITIEQKELPQPMIVGSTTFCPGSSTQLSIDQTYSSQIWNLNGDISTDPTYVVSQNGLVNLEVSDELGCLGSVELQVSSNPDLSPIISGDQLLCENTMGLLDVGNEYDNYQWSTGAMTSEIPITEADTYSVTVSTNDGCSGTASVDVPIVPNPVVEITGRDGFCTGESTLLHIPEFPAIRWSDGSINDTIDIDQAGIVIVEVTDLNGCRANAQINIAEWALPDVSIVGDETFCEGDSTLLTLSSMDIEKITLVEWDNGASTNTIYAKETEERQIIVEDSFGCEQTASINVVKNPNPTPQIIAPSAICEGTATKIFTELTYPSYSWNNTETIDTLLISNGGTYDVMVTDDNGCNGSTAATIVGSEVPIITFKTGITLCNAKIDSRPEPLSINLDTVFAQKNVTGNWSTTATNLDLSNLPIIDFEGMNPGQYEFTYTSTDANAPCTDISETIAIEVLDCNCPNVQIQPIATLCSLSDVLDLSTIQSSDFEGSWQIVEGPSSSLPSIAGDVFNAMDQMPGAYVLEFRLVDGIAPLGCATSKAVNLEVAPHIDAAIEVVQPACGDNPATLMLNLSGGNLYNVDIMKDDGQMISLFEVSDGHLFDVPLSGPTSFSFAQISSDSQACGFEASSNQYLFQPSRLDAQMELNQQYGAFGVSCIDAADGSAGVNILSGTAPYTYSWNNEATTPTITGLVEGTYSVTVEDAIGCTFNAAVDINAPPVKQLEIEAEDPICGQGPGRLLLKTIEGIEDGQWEFYLDGVLRSETQLPVSFNDIPPGSHTLEAYNEQGCMESHSFYIQDDSAYAIDIEDVNITLGASAVLQANFGYAYESITWNPDIYLTTTNAQTVVVEQPLNSIVYTITVIDTEGCIIEKTVTVNVDKERLLSVPTGFTPNGDSNNDAFIIHAKSDVAVINNISVFNRWGEEVFTAENVVPNQPINWDWTYRNEPLLEGQYVWKATATFIDDADLKFSGQFYIIQ